MAEAERHGKGWRARWTAPRGSPVERPSKSGFRTKTAARRYAEDREAEIRAGTYIDPKLGETTVHEWWLRWYPAQDLAPNTLESYAQQYNKHIRPRWGEVPLASVLGIDLETWRVQLREAHVSSSALGIIFAVVRGMFDSAVFNKMLGSSPVPPPARRGRRHAGTPPRRGVVIPLETIEQILARLRRDDERLIVLLAFLTGMRWSEIAAMRTGDLHLTPPRDGREASGYYRIDPERGGVHEDVHSRRFFGPPKSGAKDALGPGYAPGRIIDFPPMLVLILLAYLETLPVTKDGLLFPNRNGRPRQYDNWNTGIWRRAVDGRPAAVSAQGRNVREAEPAIWPGLKFHDLKHTHGALLDDLRVHPVMRDYRLGHVTPGTRGLYSHPTDQMRAELVSALQQFMVAWSSGGLRSAWPSWRDPAPPPISPPKTPRKALGDSMLF